MLLNIIKIIKLHILGIINIFKTIYFKIELSNISKCNNIQEILLSILKRIKNNFNYIELF